MGAVGCESTRSVEEQPRDIEQGLTTGFDSRHYFAVAPLRSTAHGTLTGSCEAYLAKTQVSPERK